MTALTRSLTSSTRARLASSTSSGLTCLVLIAAARARAERESRSSSTMARCYEIGLTRSWLCPPEFPSVCAGQPGPSGLLPAHPGGDQVGGLSPGAVRFLQVVVGLDELQRFVRRRERVE